VRRRDRAAAISSTLMLGALSAWAIAWAFGVLPALIRGVV
jgi:hypothetical protein